MGNGAIFGRVEVTGPVLFVANGLFLLIVPSLYPLVRVSSDRRFAMSDGIWTFLVALAGLVTTGLSISINSSVDRMPIWMAIFIILYWLGAVMSGLILCVVSLVAAICPPSTPA